MRQLRAKGSMSAHIKVLIVDDSAVVRQVLTEVLAQDTDIG
jgi:chemotaxis response regulator CheB